MIQIHSTYTKMKISVLLETVRSNIQAYDRNL